MVDPIRTSCILKKLRDKIMASFDAAIDEAVVEERELKCYIRESAIKRIRDSTAFLSELDGSNSDHQSLKRVHLKVIKNAEAMLM